MNSCLGWVIALLTVALFGHRFGPIVIGAGVLALVLARRARIKPPAGLLFWAATGLILIAPFPGIASGGLASASGTPGDPFGGACRPVVTQGYGPTDFPGEPIVDGVRTHTGIDLACPAGTPVHAVSAGTARVQFDSGFGNSVVVESGGYFFRYAHLSAVSVADGTTVRAGDLIGAEGSTGYSTGPHLHFEVDQGAPSVQRSVDPRPWLAGI